MAAALDESAFRDAFNLVIEKLRVSRCALYVLERGGTFRLTAAYGFSRGEKIAEKLSRTDPLAEWVFERREPSFINDIRLAGRMKAVMEAASAGRMLAAPLYVDGRIVAIMEIREKLNGEPFTSHDVSWVLEALRRLAVAMKAQEAPPETVAPPANYSVFEQTVTFHPQTGTIVSGRKPEFGIPAGTYEVAPQAPPVPVVPAPAPVPVDPFPSSTDRLIQLIDERIASSARPAAEAEGGSLRESSFYRFFTEAFGSLPGVEAVALSVYEPDQLQVWLACRKMLSPDAEAVFYENLDRALGKSGTRLSPPVARMINPVFVGPKPEGGTSELLAKADVGAIQSSLVSAAPGEVILFSLVFRRSASPVDRDSAKPVHVLVKNALVEVRSAVKYRESYRGLVSLFLEPGLKKYSALKTHSLNVGRMARKFATHLGLGPSAIEQLTVAGILHDVGMRELNYDEIYGKRTLNENEIRLVRQHPKLGAFLLEGVSWPYPIAPLVKHHHERWDGGGYPDGLRAEEIPFGSRIIHLCETFDAMTSPSSYRQIYATSQALEIIASKRGTQFDPELTPAFVQLAESLEA